VASLIYVAKVGKESFGVYEQGRRSIRCSMRDLRVFLFLKVAVAVFATLKCGINTVLTPKASKYYHTH